MVAKQWSPHLCVQILHQAASSIDEVPNHAGEFLHRLGFCLAFCKTGHRRRSVASGCTDRQDLAAGLENGTGGSVQYNGCLDTGLLVQAA